MNKYICILIGAALLGACEQKTETVTPPPASSAASPEATTATSPAPSP